MAIIMDVDLGAVYDEQNVLITQSRVLQNCYCKLSVFSGWNHRLANGEYYRGAKATLNAVNDDATQTVIRPIKQIVITEADGSYTHGGDILAQLYAQAMKEFPGAKAC